MPSMGWLLKTVEEFIRGVNLRDFFGTFRVGNIEHVAQRRVNSHGRFLELLEYGAGGQQRRKEWVELSCPDEEGGSLF